MYSISDNISTLLMPALYLQYNTHYKGFHNKFIATMHIHYTAMRGSISTNIYDVLEAHCYVVDID